MPSLFTTPEAMNDARSLDIDNRSKGVIPTKQEMTRATVLNELGNGRFNKEAYLNRRNEINESLKSDKARTWLQGIGPMFENAWKRGKISDQRLDLGAEYFDTDDDSILEKIRLNSEAMQDIPRDIKTEAIYERIAAGTTEALPTMIDIFKEGGIYAGAFAAIGGGVGVAAGPAAPVTAPTLAGMGARLGFRIGMFKESAKKATGGFYLDLLDMGVSKKNAKPLAYLVGRIEGLVEVYTMGTASLFTKGVLKGIKKKSMKAAVGYYLKKVATQTTKSATKSVLLQTAKQTGIGTAREYGEELVQSGVELTARKFISHWDQQYVDYVNQMKNSGQEFVDPNTWAAIGKEYLAQAEGAGYAVLGLGGLPAMAHVGEYGLKATMKSKIPAFQTSDEVDAWTANVATEKDLPALADARESNRALYRQASAEGDLENALKYGQQGAFYREAIENITGLHGEALRPSKIATSRNYARRMVDGIKSRLGQQGAITVEWPGYNKEQAVIQRQKLLARRASILKNAGSVGNVGTYLRGKGVPPGIADSVKTYIRSEVEKPFQYSLRKSATHAKKYRGLDNGSEWYRKIGFEEIIRNETPEEAAKFFAIVGETSRQKDPLVNLALALHIWEDYKAGEPIEEIAKRGGLVPEDEMLSLLKDGKKAIRWTEDLVGQEEGQIKLRDFVQTLEFAFKDPELLDTYAESVLDFRMGQYFYNEDLVPGGVRRERGKEQMLAIRDYLRKTDDPAFWTTDRVQAALWHWIKDERVKKGQDPDRPQWTFDNAKKRLVGDYYGVDMRDVNESYVRGYVKSILTDGEMLIYDHYSKHANIKILDPTNQGTGLPGREWSRQVVPGEDRPRVVHLYQGKTKAERQFVNMKRYRAIFKAGKLYDFKADPLGLRKKYAHLVAKADPIEFGKREQEMIDAGYLGFAGGHMAVVFDPVRVMRMRGFYLAASSTFTPEQMADAKANAPDFTVAAMEEIDALEKEGKDDEVATKVREYLLKDLGSPIIDILQVNTAEGFWEAEAEKSIITMVEAGDKVVLRGKLAKFLNRFWQYVGVMSEYSGQYKIGAKRPQGIQKEQAPSVVLQFKEDLPCDILVRFNENLSAFGIKGSTYDEKNKTLIIHHVKERDYETREAAYPVRDIKFAGIIDNAINWSNLPDHTLSQHWFAHTVLEKEDYKQHERIGKERETELGVGSIESDFFIDPLDLPRHIQERGDINKLAIIETEVETGKPKEIRGNLLDPELMNLTRGDKVYVIAEDHKTLYFDHWAKNHKAVVNDHWQLEGESSIMNPRDLTTQSENLYKFQNVKDKFKEVLTSERGSIELRKPRGVYEPLKDSKLVDEDGNLIPVFHGTKSEVFDINDIQPSYGGVLGPGIYFTPDPEYAGLYAGAGVYPGSRIIPAYLDIKNPFETNKPAGFLGGGEFMNSAEFIKKLKEKGHDAMFFYRPGGELAEINVFDKKQIYPIFEEDIKPTITKMILDERGSVELRKKYFKAVAMKDSMTGRILVGDESDIHATLYGKLSEIFQSRIGYDDMGFIDWEGKYYTRKEAAEVMGIEQAESLTMRKAGMLEGVAPSLDRMMGREKGLLGTVKKGIVEFGERHGVLEKIGRQGPMFIGDPKERGGFEIPNFLKFFKKDIDLEGLPEGLKKGFEDLGKGEISKEQFARKQTWSAMAGDITRDDIRQLQKIMNRARLEGTLAMSPGGAKGFFKMLEKGLQADLKMIEKRVKKTVKALTKKIGLPKDSRQFLELEFYRFIVAFSELKTTEDAISLRAEIDATIKNDDIKEALLTEIENTAFTRLAGIPKKIEVRAAFGERGAIEFDPSVFRGISERAKPWPTERRVSDVDEVIDLTEIVSTKARVRAITGQVKLGTLVTTEAVVLKRSLQRQAQAAREAFIAGKREGVDITTVKLEDLKGKQRERIAALQAKFQEYKDHVKEMKEMARTRREVSKIIESMKTIGKKLKTIPDPERSTLEDFFKEFDLTKLTVKNRLKLQKTKAWLIENQEDVELPERIWSNLDRLEKTAIRDLTVDEIRDIGNMVNHIYTLAKNKQKIWINRKQRDFTEALQTSIEEMKPKLVAAGEALSSLPSRFEKFGKSWDTVRNMLGLYQEHYDLVIESLAGPKSVLYDVLYKTVKRGIVQQLAYKQRVIATLYETTGREFMQEHGIGNMDAWLKESVSLGKHTITRDQRMALYRHMMNDDNRDAILKGGIGLKSSLDPDAVIELTEDEVLRTLAEIPRAELIFAGNAVSGLFEKQGFELAKVFRERNGYELELVRNYYPKDTMPLGFSSHDFQSKKTLEELTRKVNRIGIEKGMLHHRLGATFPIYLNGMTEDINKSIHNAGAYIGLELPLTQASRLLGALKQELPQRYGRETYRVIDKGLRDIAGEWQTFTEFEKALMKLKDKATTAILGLNPWVMMKQVMSLPMYWRYVDMEHVIKGALKSIWNPKEVAARHKLFSPEYMERVEVGYSRDVADVFKPGKRFLLQKRKLTERLLGGIQLFDKMAVIPGMQGAVDMVLDQMKEGKLSDQVKVALDIVDADIPKLSVGERIRLAYQYADFATQRTQPMFSPEHRSALSRGGPVEKIMTMFGSATNQFLNMILRDYRSAVERKDKGANSKLMQSLFLLLVVNPVGIAALDRLRDWWYDREPDEPFAADWLKNIAGYVFFLRDVVSYTFNKLQGKHYGFGTPISMFGDLFGDILSQMSTLASSDDKKKTKKAAGRMFEKILQLALLTQGLPYQTPKLLITGTKERRKKSP